MFSENQSDYLESSLSKAKMKVLGILGALGLAATQGAIAAPNPIIIGSSLTILKDNDLWAQYSNRTSSAILLEEPKTFAAGKLACAALSEGLWSPETQSFTAGLNNSLSYQAYIRKFSYSQQFWVADYDDKNPKTKDTCRAIDLAGKVKALDCLRLLPTLCSHSAPMSNINFRDTSEPYQVAVKTGKQTITGFRDSYGFRFIGVRYADDPGRFKYTTVADLTGSVKALEYGSWCLQPDGPAPNYTYIGSEDCFFLNIASPYLPNFGVQKKDLKPVFFWIHGGGFIENSGDLGHSDNVNLASRGDIVSVKINYRVGHFGFLALNGTNITGNYGLVDMITALKWVKKNIEAFGGDADRITIAGDSAGAAAVRALLASEAADGLYHAAILHSTPNGWAPFAYFSEYVSIPEYTALFGPVVSQGTGCNPSADFENCLRNVNGTALAGSILAPANMAFPVQDNIILKVRELPVTGKGYVAKVPTIFGINRDETAILLAPYYGIQSAAQFLGLFSQVISEDVTRFANHPAFPQPPGDAALSAFNLTQEVSTGMGYKCLAYASAYSAVKHKVLPDVYIFEANRTYQPLGYTYPVCEPPATAEHPYGDPEREYFKCHSGDLGYAMGEILFSGRKLRDENDIWHQQVVVDYWSAFIREHDPNPKPGYLKARGYWQTLNQMDKVGKWEKVNTRHPKKKWLQWNGGMVDMGQLGQAAQCDALRQPLDYFEAHL